MILSDRAVLPLTGSTFEPGNAEKVIKEIEDKIIMIYQHINQYTPAKFVCENYSKNIVSSFYKRLCAETVKPYLSHEDIMLRLSADMLYTFANLTIGDSKAAQQARDCLQSAFWHMKLI